MPSSESTYRNLFNCASALVFVVETATDRILYANPSAASYFHIPAKDLAGQSYSELWKNRKGSDSANKNTDPQIHPDDIQQEVFEYQGQKLQANYTDCSWEGKEAFIAYINDLSTLTYLNSIVTEMMDNLPCGISIMEEENGKYVRRYLNEEGAAVLGYASPKDAPTAFDRILNRIHQDDREEVRQHFLNAFENHASGSFDYRIRVNRKTRYINVLYKPNFNKKTGLWSVYCTYADVTPLREASAQLKQSEAEYRAIAKQSRDMVARYHSDTRIMTLSEKGAAFIGLTDPVIPNAPTELIRNGMILPESIKPWLSLFAAIDSGKESGMVPAIGIQCKNSDTVRWMNARFTAIPESKPAGLTIISFSIITDRKAGEI